MLTGRFLNPRIVLTSFLLAHKYLTEGLRLRMSAFGMVGGLSGQELKALEREFVKMIDYKLHVDRETLNSYQRSIELYA